MGVALSAKKKLPAGITGKCFTGMRLGLLMKQLEKNVNTIQLETPINLIDKIMMKTVLHCMLCLQQWKPELKCIKDHAIFSINVML